MGRTMSVLAFLAELPGFENSRNVEMTTYDYGKILADPGEGTLICMMIFGSGFSFGMGSDWSLSSSRCSSIPHFA
jgi:hypothetical protein